MYFERARIIKKMMNRHHRTLSTLNSFAINASGSRRPQKNSSSGGGGNGGGSSILTIYTQDEWGFIISLLFIINTNQALIQSYKSRVI